MFKLQSYYSVYALRMQSLKKRVHISEQNSFE